jgi:hypothetical protein
MRRSKATRQTACADGPRQLRVRAVQGQPDAIRTEPDSAARQRPQGHTGTVNHVHTLPRASVQDSLKFGNGIIIKSVHSRLLLETIIELLQPGPTCLQKMRPVGIAN